MNNQYKIIMSVEYVYKRLYNLMKYLLNHVYVQVV